MPLTVVPVCTSDMVGSAVNEKFRVFNLSLYHSRKTLKTFRRPIEYIHFSFLNTRARIVQKLVSLLKKTKKKKL